MKRNSIIKGIFISAALIKCVLCNASYPGADKDPVILSASSWTIKAEPETGILSLEHDSLGPVMNDIRLNLKTRQGLISFSKWNAEKKGDRQLSIQTTQPGSAWLFELNKSNIIISCTSVEMVLTAKVPVSSERIVCRLIDPEGVPVNWTGTSEISGSWKGKETWNQSYLPSKNPEVMTFSLGQVSSSNLHSLFDRETDIAIDFTANTFIQTSLQDPGQLDVTIPVPGNTIVRIIADYYTKTLGLPAYKRFDDSVFPSAPIIWGSWTAYYYEARESDIVSNADWIAANLKPYGFQYVQIDDGYDRGREEGHYWIENWNQTLFPHGPEWLAKYIKSKGLRPGLWLVPNSYAGAYQQHPDWYLYDKSGNTIKDYRTPALDYTNPGVQEWLRKLFSTLKGWGYEYFKFDGELALPVYVPSVDKTKLYNKSADLLAEYQNRLKIIRNVIGPDTFIEGCVAGAPIDGIGFFNSCFNGADMYNSWKGSYAVFSSINANAFLNHMVVYAMPGEGIDVSPLMSAEEARGKMGPRAIQVAESRETPFTGFGTTLAEARTLVSIVSLTGVPYPLTSIMPRLPEERVRLLKMTMPTMPILPVDLYSRGTDITWDKFKYTSPDIYIHNYPEIIDLKVNAKSGVYDVVALTNWRSTTAAKEILFADKLGLGAGIPYVVFDFWNQKLAGVYRDRMEITIEPHDTRVLLVHELKNRPQLIGTSRHITGAYSILGMDWNGLKNTLSGSLQTVEGDPFTLFIFIPDGMSISQIRVVTSDNRELKVNRELTGNLLKLSFQGQSKTVSWQVVF
jgi:hypothetical protein